MMVRFFKTQGREVIANLRKLEKKSIKVDLNIEGLLFDAGKWRKELEKRGFHYIAATVLYAMMQLTTDATVDHPYVRTALGQRVVRFSQFVNNTTHKEVQDVVRAGFTEGLGVEEIAEKLQEEVFELQHISRRARLIARTEVAGAQNFGTQKGMQLGGYERKMWLTSRDDRVRESHMIDGAVVAVDSMFTLTDGTQMEYPMDFNERCFHTPTKEEINQ